MSYETHRGPKTSASRRSHRRAGSAVLAMALLWGSPSALAQDDERGSDSLEVAEADRLVVSLGRDPTAEGSAAQPMVEPLTPMVEGAPTTEGAPRRGREEIAEESSLRPMAADRPDATESPQTVDAGHFQMETDIFAYTLDQGLESWSFSVANLKLGLLDFMDVQLILEPLVVRLRDPAVSTETQTGFGGVTMRVKVNLFGNDGGGVALGLLPWVSFPVLGSDQWEAGLAVPFSAELPWDLGLGAQIEADVAPDARGQGYHLELLGTLALGRQIYGPLSIFVEVAARYGMEGDRFIVTANGGLLFEVNENLVFDLGAYVGLTDEAPDFVGFLGVTTRI